jgi:translation initiation factor IF-3
LIGSEGEQIGVVPLKEALSRAYEADLDLVEISPNANPPVCKILDYGKYKFQQQKRAAEAKKKQQTVTVKEISIRPRTEEHDYQIKMKKVFEFLEKGDKVKINMRFRGREIANQEMAVEMMERIETDTAEVARVDQKPNMQGRQMSMLLSPDKSGAAKKAKEQEAEQKAAAE